MSCISFIFLRIHSFEKETAYMFLVCCFSPGARASFMISGLWPHACSSSATFRVQPTRKRFGDYHFSFARSQRRMIDIALFSRQAAQQKLSILLSPFHSPRDYHYFAMAFHTVTYIICVAEVYFRRLYSFRHAFLFSFFSEEATFIDLCRRRTTR